MGYFQLLQNSYAFTGHFSTLLIMVIPKDTYRQY
jgi:hypothetical protein